jgi:hypothetical protein
MTDTGRLRTVVSQTFPLAQGRRAFEGGGQPRPLGKTVLVALNAIGRNFGVGLAALIDHGADGCVTRCTSMISSPRPTIRSTSPGSAAGSGISARRVVVSGLVVTVQSSNCACSVLPAWPLKVISYVRDRTGIMPRSWWLTLASECLTEGSRSSPDIG